MAVADGALVFVGYSATVGRGFYVADDAQTLEQCAPPDFLEQSVALV